MTSLTQDESTAEGKKWVSVDEWFSGYDKRRDPRGRYYRYKSPKVGGEWGISAGAPGSGKRS